MKKKNEKPGEPRQKKEEKRILIFQDRNRIEQEKARIEEAIPLIQDSWDLYKQLPYYDKSHDLKTIIGGLDPIIQAHRLQLAKNLDFGGQKINLAEASKLVLLPESNMFDHALNLVKQRLEKVSIDYFVLDSKGKVIINQEVYQAFVDQNSLYAGTPEEKAVWKEYNKLKASLLSFDKVLRKEADMPILNPTGIAPLQKWFAVSRAGLEIRKEFVQMLFLTMRRG